MVKSEIPCIAVWFRREMLEKRLWKGNRILLPSWEITVKLVGWFLKMIDWWEWILFYSLHSANLTTERRLMRRSQVEVCGARRRIIFDPAYLMACGKHETDGWIFCFCLSLFPSRRRVCYDGIFLICKSKRLRSIFPGAPELAVCLLCARSPSVLPFVLTEDWDVVVFLLFTLLSVVRWF